LNHISSNTGDNNDFEKVSSQVHYDYKFKVLLLGSSGVGKTCLVERLRNPAYNITSTTSTIGIDPLSQSFKYNSSFVHVQITDTAGQERYFAIQPMYFRDVQGIFLVYDVMWKETFKSLERWLNIAKQHCTESHLQVILVGNKVDCLYRGKKVDRTVSKESALEFAKINGFSYVETSVIDKNLDSLMNMYKKMVESLVAVVDLNKIKVEINNSKSKEIKESKVDLYTTDKTSKCRCRRSNTS
jgi:small GTP-binding protein